jgi:DNA invertase Pin-like site-specific DNA recombinase
MKRYIIYYRSWAKKVPSRVEVTAQRADAERFVSYNQGRIAATYTEKEGKHEPRVELPKAVDHAQRLEATLVICHIGRLARNVPVTRLLLNSQVDFVCLDNHDIIRSTIHIIAGIAEEETRKVSDRAKTGMALAKARGAKFASARPDHWKGREHLRGTYKAIANAAKIKKERTKGAYALMMPKIKELREQGGTLPEIVEWLNNQGHTTTAGKPFTQTAVWRLIGRYLGKEYLGNIKKKTQGNKVAVAAVS